MSIGKSWLQPKLFPALDALEHAEAERIITLAWLQAWRRPWWRSPVAIKTVVMFAVGMALFIAAIIILPWHFVLLFFGAQWVLTILFGDFLQRLVLRRDMARCIDRVLAAEHAGEDAPDSSQDFSNDGALIKVVRFFLPAVQGLPACEVIRVTNAASKCMGLKKPIRGRTAVKILISVIVGGIAYIVIGRISRDAVSPEIESLISYLSLILWLFVVNIFYVGEVNFHAERIIAEEASGMDVSPEDG
jgi:hypothetical protein